MLFSDDTCQWFVAMAGAAAERSCKMSAETDSQLLRELID